MEPYNATVERLAFVLEGNINDTVNSLRFLADRLSPLRDCGNDSPLTLDISRVKYLGPDGATMLCGSVLEARNRGIDIDVRWPEEPPALEAFINFSGLRHFLAAQALPDQQHPENVTVALRNFEQSRVNDSDPILELIARFKSISEKLRESLEIAVNETVQNIADHSHSSIGGWGCARFMARDGEVRVSLMDWGDGILTTLRRRHPDTSSDRQALERVLFGGYSALSRRNNLGRGIDNLRMVVTKAMGGKLFILSGYAAVEAKANGEPRYSDLEHGFRGTAVCFSMPVD